MKGSFLKMLNKNLTFVILAASLLAVFSARAYSLPIIQNEEITTVTDTSVIITWTTTNENSDTKVYYGTGTPSNVYSSLESTKYHYAIIDSLSPGTTYYYYVKSGSTEGSQKIFTTLTPPSGSYLFSFATVSDPQYGMGKSDTYGARGRPYSKSKQMLEALVSSLNRLNPSFTILKGDLIESLGGTYGEYVDNQNIPGDTETIKDKFDNLTGAYYPIPGNHDKEITAYSGGNTSSWYNSNLSPLNPSLVIPDPTKNSCYNYSFDTNGYRFIMLDSIRSNLTASIDATYLSTQLLSAESLGLKSFIFVHHPVTDLRSEGIPAEVLKEVAGGTTSLAISVHTGIL